MIYKKRGFTGGFKVVSEGIWYIRTLSLMSIKVFGKGVFGGLDQALEQIRVARVGFLLGNVWTRHVYMFMEFGRAIFY